MLRLNFKVFNDKLESERMNGTFPTVHLLNENNKFIFIFKSKEEWKYYSVVHYKDIKDYCDSSNISLDKALELFISNYCANTVPLEKNNEKDIYNLIPELNKNLDNLQRIPQKTNLLINQKSSDIISFDIIEEAENYSDFLLKTFNMFEKKVLSSLNKLDLKKKLDKSFGDFLRNLFNSVNTVSFARQVKRYLRMDLIVGLESAEEETNMDIGFTSAYEDKLNQLHAQQLDGYVINGKKWFGIKGVTKEIQSEIIKIVQDGISNNKSLNDVKEEIKSVFDNFSEWRSSLIARTETNRIINEGKLLGYKESGLKGGKVVIVALDNRTTNICKNMHTKYSKNPIPLDDYFVDDITNKQFLTPPFHPNCRTTLAFRPK